MEKEIKPQKKFFGKIKFEKLFLYLFISAWMFVLGVFVGRRSVPVKFDIKEIAENFSLYKKTDEKKNQQAFIFNNDDNELANKSELGFYKSLKTVDDDIKPKATLSEANEKEKKPVNKENINELQDAFTIQIASFKDSDDAENLVKKLKDKGYNAYKVMAGVSNKGIWYRVRIDNLRNKKDVYETLARLKKDKFADMLIIRQWTEDR
mmetsp:Transcript_8512/g.4643  ORF Transcript_8512/g.4643 Transcript_8512/m.4643 type:complete len:207 (+) Transcript_8512:2117-2737(+)